MKRQLNNDINSVHGLNIRKVFKRLLLCVVSPKYGVFSLKYDNTQRKPNRADKQGYSVLHGKETEAEFDCSPDRLGKINTDGFCRKEQQR